MKKRLLFLFLLLSIFTIVGCGKQNEEEKQPVTKNEEVEITDTKLIDDLEQKSNILYNIGKVDGGGLGKFFSDNYTIDSFDDKERLTAILVYAHMNPTKITKSNLTIDELKTYEPGWYEEGTTAEYYEGTFFKVDGSTIANLYKSLYNANISNYENNMSCPRPSYEEGLNAYIYISTCGNSGEDYLYTYNYKYTKDNDNAYVYVSIAVQKNEDGHIYSDINMTNKYKDYDETNGRFEITEDNYKDLDQYKIIFNYNSSTKEYNFSKVEKV